MRRQLESEMATSLLLTVEASVVKARVSLGKVGGTISTVDSEAGNALMLVITNPFGPKVEITSCVGERSTGFLGRGRQRFVIPMHGLPYQFGEDGERCLAWANTRYLPSFDGLIQLYLIDSAGNEWPVENTDTLHEICRRLRSSR
jgi:hypothetical protein